MFPFKDENPGRGFPIVTVTLIALNVVVFIVHYVLSPDPRAFTLQWALIPAQVLADPLNPRVLVNFITAMFMHGDLVHIGGNMLYLWIFGDNIEDVLGKVGFVVFYLVTGILASLSHIALNPASEIPMLGASGAISGVLGAYLLLFPAARIRTLIFIVYIVRMTVLPALYVLGFWFLYQVALGVASIGGGEGGVAYGAHVGGFLAGFALMVVIAQMQNLPTLLTEGFSLRRRF